MEIDSGPPPSVAPESSAPLPQDPLSDDDSVDVGRDESANGSRSPTPGDGESAERRSLSGRPNVTRKTPEQLARLEAAFRTNPHMTPAMRSTLGTEIGLNLGQVTKWFAAKRAKEGLTNPAPAAPAAAPIGDLDRTWLVTVLKPITDSKTPKAFEGLGRLFVSEQSSLRRLVIAGVISAQGGSDLPSAFLRGKPLSAVQEEIGRQVAAKSDDGVLKILQMLSLLPLSLDDIREYQLGKTIKSLNRDSGSEAIISLTKTLMDRWMNLINASVAKSTVKSAGAPAPAMAALARPKVDQVAAAEAERKRREEELRVREEDLRRREEAAKREDLRRREEELRRKEEELRRKEHEIRMAQQAESDAQLLFKRSQAQANVFNDMQIAKRTDSAGPDAPAAPAEPASLPAISRIAKTTKPRPQAPAAAPEKKSALPAEPSSKPTKRPAPPALAKAVSNEKRPRQDSHPYPGEDAKRPAQAHAEPDKGPRAPAPAPAAGVVPATTHAPPPEAYRKPDVRSYPAPTVSPPPTSERMPAPVPRSGGVVKSILRRPGLQKPKRNISFAPDGQLAQIRTFESDPAEHDRGTHSLEMRRLNREEAESLKKQITEARPWTTPRPLENVGPADLPARGSESTETALQLQRERGSFAMFMTSSALLADSPKEPTEAADLGAADDATCIEIPEMHATSVAAAAFVAAAVGNLAGLTANPGLPPPHQPPFHPDAYQPVMPPPGGPPPPHGMPFPPPMFDPAAPPHLWPQHRPLEPWQIAQPPPPFDQHDAYRPPPQGQYDYDRHDRDRDYDYDRDYDRDRWDRGRDDSRDRQRSDGKRAPCRFFNMSSGCRRGSECRYDHVKQ